MDLTDRLLILCWRDNAVFEMWLNQIPAFRLESLSHTAAAGWKSDDAVRDVTRLHGPNEVLTGKQTEVLFDWEDAGFKMEMIDVRRGVTSSDETERLILDKLETTDGSGRIIRVDDGCRIVEKRADERLEGRREALFVMPKIRIRQGADDIVTRTCLPGDSRRMGREGEGRVQRYS